MARVIGFVLVVALGVAGALVLVSERRAATRAGYRIAELERERLRLVEENRHLEAGVARLKTPSRMAARAAALGLDVVPPEERLKEQLADEQGDGTRGGGARR